MGDFKQAMEVMQPEFVAISTDSSQPQGNQSFLDQWLTPQSLNKICSQFNNSTSSSKDDAKSPNFSALDATVHTNRAAVLCMQGRLSDATQQVMVVLEKFGAFVPAIRTLVYIQIRQGDRPAAVSTLQKYCNRI